MANDLKVEFQTNHFTPLCFVLKYPESIERKCSWNVWIVTYGQHVLYNDKKTYYDSWFSIAPFVTFCSTFPKQMGTMLSVSSDRNRLKDVHLTSWTTLSAHMAQTTWPQICAGPSWPVLLLKDTLQKGFLKILKTNFWLSKAIPAFNNTLGERAQFNEANIPKDKLTWHAFSSKLIEPLRVKDRLTR